MTCLILSLGDWRGVLGTKPIENGDLAQIFFGSVFYTSLGDTKVSLSKSLGLIIVM